MLVADAQAPNRPQVICNRHVGYYDLNLTFGIIYAIEVKVHVAIHVASLVGSTFFQTRADRNDFRPTLNRPSILSGITNALE